MVRIQHYNEQNKICFTLRQWSLLLAIIAFVSISCSGCVKNMFNSFLICQIITSLLTFGAILGLRHTRDAWELVLADLAEEENQNAISVYFSEHQQYKSNKRLLHQSQHVVQGIFYKMLFFCCKIKKNGVKGLHFLYRFPI